MECSIRLMTEDDEAAFRSFHTVIPEREQLFIKSEIRDGSLFRRWMSQPELGRHIALLAFVDGELSAIGSLHQRLGGWKRHIGDVYFHTHPHFRGFGILDKLRDAVIDIARHSGLTRLESELNGERTSAIQSMAAAGFRELLRLPDYVQDMRANCHDYVLMGMDLMPAYENLGTGD